MALVVETGAIVAGANSYLTLVEVDDFMLQSNITDWESATDEVREAAIVIGQLAMDAKYSKLYRGYPVSRDQTMAWPRTRTMNNPDNPGATQEPIIDGRGFEWATTEIPSPVKNAALQAILVEFTGTFTVTTVTRDDYIKRKKLDVLETEWFDGVQSVGSAPYHPLVDQILCGSGLADSASPNSIVFRITVAPWETDCYAYNWGNRFHTWAGTSPIYQSWEPYRDLCHYFYEAKGW